MGVLRQRRVRKVSLEGRGDSGKLVTHRETDQKNKDNGSQASHCLRGEFQIWNWRKVQCFL